MGHVLYLRKGSVHTTPGKVLPAGYTKLQYIQSTGTQWIDTGFKPNQNTRIKMDCNVIGFNAVDAFLFGARISSGNTAFCLAADDANTQWFALYGNAVLNPTGTCTGKHSIDFNQNVLTLDGENFTFEKATFQSSYNLLLFATITNGSVDSQRGKMAVYSCQLYDNGTLIRDYVPCKNPSGVVGLYDLTGEQFYGNSGTGVFYAGPPVVTLPEGYTQLMYLESSGTQYINTGFTPNQDARIQLDCERTAANATDHFFGVRTGNSASSAFAFYIYNSGWRWAYNNATATGTGPDIGRYFIDANKNVTTINGDTTLTGTYASFTAAAAAPLFAMLSAPSGFSYGSFRLYTCRIYNNGLMVRNFIPCRNASGTIGLYDLVNGQFYTNAGTGTFTAGEVA